MPIRQICVCSAILMLVLAGSWLLHHRHMAEELPAAERAQGAPPPFARWSSDTYKAPFQSREYVRIVRDYD